MASESRSKRVLTWSMVAIVVMAGIGLLADLMGITSFVTGQNLPGLLGNPPASKQSPLAQRFTAVTPLGAPLEGHTDEVGGLAFSPTGHQLATAGDVTWRLWDVQARTQIGDPVKGHDDLVLDIAFNAAGTRVATASADRTIRLWDTESRAEVRRFTGHEEWVRTVAISPNGKLLVSGSDDFTVRLWRVDSGEQVGQPLKYTWEQAMRSPGVMRVAFNRDGSVIAAAFSNNTVKMWRVSDLTELGGPLAGVALAFSPVTDLLATADLEGGIRFWDKGNEVGPAVSGLSGLARDVAFSTDGSVLACVDGSNVRFYETSGHKALSGPVAAHVNWVSGVAFSPDGATFATSSSDGTVRFWRLSQIS